MEEALPLLAQRKYFSEVPHGYARGWEPVQYVNNVRNYYSTLSWLTLDERFEEQDQDALPHDAGVQTAAESMPLTF